MSSNRKRQEKVLNAPVPPSVLATVLLVMVFVLALVVGPTLLRWGSEEVDVVVYRSRKCQCVREWIERLRSEGYSVAVKQPLFVSAIRERYGVPENFTSCHTSIARQYFIEGHVPIASVRELIVNQPPIAGVALLSEPGRGSVERPTGNDLHEVVAVDFDGHYTVFGME